MSDDKQKPDDNDDLLHLSAAERAALEQDDESHNVVELHGSEQDDFDIDEIERVVSERTSLDVEEESLFNEDEVDSESGYSDEEELFDNPASDSDHGNEDETVLDAAPDLNEDKDDSGLDENGLVFSDEESQSESSNKNKYVLYGLITGFLSFIGILIFIAYSLMSPSVPDAVRSMPKPIAKNVISIPKELPSKMEPKSAAVVINESSKPTATRETPKLDSQTVQALPEPSGVTKTVVDVETPAHIPSGMVPKSSEAKSLANALESNQSSKSPISFKEFSDLQEKTKSLEAKLRELSNTTQQNTESVVRNERNTTKAFESMMSRLATLQQSLASLSESLESKTLSAADLTQGRIRLGQFNVLNVNRDGSAVAHAPSGNRISLKQGEVISIGPERMTVTKIYPEQDIVHIGQNWYIDIRREPIGPEERALRRELQTAQIEQRDSDFVSVSAEAGKLSYSEAYEVRAVVQNKVMLHNCATRHEQIYTISDAIPGHGVIRSIRANEVVTDMSVFKFDACYSTGG